MKMEEIPVLITGVGGQAGQSTFNYFSNKGFPLIGTDVRDVETDADSFYKIPPADDRSFPTAIIDIIRKERPFLFVPTVTEELHIISRLKKVIEAYGCVVFISPPDAIDIANDKLKTAVIMAGNGMSVPVSFDETTPKEVIVKTLNFPIISKPRTGMGSRGVTLYWNPEELFKETRKDLIYQEFIAGEEFDINMFINKDGEIIANTVLKKTALREGLIGNAIEVESVKRADIEQFGIRAAKTLKLTGPINMDIRMKEDGTPVLLEINARIGRNVHAAPDVLDSLLIEATSVELSLV
ncbi:MAG: ATP-grasp domain-containing protein [Nitrospirae bacterium]|nr:ATP-grasp domain-containing protein [Nitrospirota bacterium]